MLNSFQYNLRYNQDQMYWVKQPIKEARDADNDLHQLVDEFRANFAYERRAFLILLELIYQIVSPPQAAAAENELRLALEIAARFEISSYDQRTIEAKYMYRQRQRRGHRRQPGGTVLRGARPAAGRARLRRDQEGLPQAESMQYHPDKVGHLGEEFKSIAEEKMKEINVAYGYFE